MINLSAAKKPLWWYIATWFGSGLSPFASGTAGSLAALPFAYLIHATLGGYALFIASLVAFFVGCWAAQQFVNHSGISDPKPVVIDEVAGQWLLLSALFPTWQSYVVGFILFRIFDVIKPWPVCWADEKLEGGLGVMFDDMLAGFYPIFAFLLVMIIAQLMGGQAELQPLINFLGGSYVH